MNCDEMTAAIVNAMAALATKHADFGRVRFGEKTFQKALTAELATFPNCQVAEERPFRSSRFTNKGRIKPDHLVASGEQTYAIELKYVYRQQAGAGYLPPANAPGFFYDIIKDCAKIETLIGHAADGGSIRSPVTGGFALGLADHDFWSDRPAGNWSRDFAHPDRSAWTKVDRHAVFAPVAGPAAQCIHPIIFHHGRYHVAVEDAWEYRWFNYRDDFRYVLFRRNGAGADAERAAAIAAQRELPLLRHGTIPFRDADHREAAMRIKARFSDDYTASGNICPICAGNWGL